MSDLLQLPQGERLALAIALWDSLDDQARDGALPALRCRPEAVEALLETQRRHRRTGDPTRVSARSRTGVATGISSSAAMPGPALACAYGEASGWSRW